VSARPAPVREVGDECRSTGGALDLAVLAQLSGRFRGIPRNFSAIMLRMTSVVPP